MRVVLVAALAVASWLCGFAVADAQMALPNDYANKANWLCWPGAQPNACDVDLTTTVVRAGGATSLERFKADAKAPIDCFYVYPTVSTDPGLLATMAIEPAETRVVEQQFARFGASCRLFAPVYRQFTVTALIAALTGHPLPSSTGQRPTTPYDDVFDAWKYYLAHENHGRGVVLIGHSQGSQILTELIKREFDGKPAQTLLVSAILMGTDLTVPEGKDVGGDFRAISLCRSARQTGCAIAYVSFRDTAPPPTGSSFGRPRPPSPGLAAACVNPTNLTGGEGELHAYFASGNRMIADEAGPARTWSKGTTIATPFVSLPGMLTAKCVSTPDFNYLAIHVNADPSGERASDIPGDVVYAGQVRREWGLHLIDANLAMGNLVSIVADEGRAWSAAHR